MGALEVAEAENRLTQLLIARGFDFQKPDPSLGWTVFKDTAREPVRCAGDWCYVSFGIPNLLNPGEPFRVDFVRNFSIAEKAGDFHHAKHLHLLFTCEPTPALKKLQGYLRSHDFAELDDFCDAVDNLQEFQAALSHSPWDCRVYQQTSGFRILRPLARNGGISIYKARDLEFERLVALKVCRSPDATDHQRLTHAAHLMACFMQRQKDGAVGIYSINWPQQESFIAMELVEGGTLADRLGQPWPARHAAQLAERLAIIVSGLHENGIIHREIDPTHLLFTRDEQLKLTGFRFAFNPELAANVENVGRIPLVGDPSYISPEQAIGNTFPGYATDVYAVGAVLYALLTGRPPFREKTTADAIRSVLEQEPTPPRQLQPTVPCELEAICLKCLAKDPNDRYASARALADDLSSYLRKNEGGLFHALLHRWRSLFGRRA